VSSVVVQERINPVAVEALNADVDEQQITRFNRADMLSPRTLMILMFSALRPSNMAGFAGAYSTSAVFLRTPDLSLLGQRLQQDPVRPIEDILGEKMTGFDSVICCITEKIRSRRANK
jgi:hypothetical protein